MKRLIPPVLLTLLLLAVNTLAAFHTIQSFSDNNRQVMQAHRVLAELAITRSDIQDAESEQRGYLLTGDTHMRNASQSAVSAVGSNLLILRHLTEGNSTQKSNLDVLTPAFQVWQSRLDQSAKTDLLQEPIRQMTDRMAEEEFRHLMWQSPAAEAAGKAAQRLVLTGVGLVAALLLLVGIMGGLYHREQKRTDAALRSSQEDLEIRVRERTQQLEEAGRTVREREQRFRFLADAMPQIVWTTRPDGVADFYNQRWHEYTGLTLEQTENGGIQAMVHPEDMVEIEVDWSAAMASGQPYSMEYRLLRTDSQYRWHLGRVMPLRDECGEIIFWAGTGTDIDDYKQVEAALHRSYHELEERVGERTADLEAARDRLAESEAQFRSAIDAMQEGLIVQNRERTVLLSNETAEALLRFAPGTLTGSNFQHPHWQRVAEDGSEFPAEDTPGRRAFLTGQPQPPTLMGFRWANGEITWLLTNAAPLRHVGEETPYAVVITFTDVTDRRRAEEALRQAEEGYRGIFENSVEGIFQSSLEGRFLTVNPATARMLGYESPQAVMEELTDIANQLYESPVDRGRLLALLLAQDKVTGFETAFRRRDGRSVWVSMNARLHRDSQGKIEYLEGSVQDITKRRADDQRLLDYNIVLEFQKQELEKTNAELARVNDQLETLATLDGLTGLKNHRAFQERLGEEFDRARRYALPLSLVMLDVDKFKDYNDAFGHPAGDDVLRRVARILEVSVRECDFTARYGGEEFVLILPQTDSEGASIIAERCRAAIEEADWPSRPITASFGVASLSLTLSSAAEGTALLTEADELLYVAKANGRNQVVRSHSMRPGTTDRNRNHDFDLSR